MKKLFILILAIGTLMACKNTGTKPESDAPNPKLAEFAERTKDVFNTPSKPSQISVLLEMSGAPLMTSIMNDPANVESYKQDDIWAAANLGVYMADAVVQYAYDSISLAYKSAVAAKTLAGHLGIGEDVFMGIIKDRYAEEGGQSDSLYFMLDSVLAKTESALNADERFRLLAAVFVGNFIEKQFIVANIIFDYPVELPEDAKLLVLREMMFVYTYYTSRLDYIIELVETAETVDDPGFLSTELKALKASIDSYQFTQEEIYSMTPKMIFENEILLKEYEMIKNMRNYIVNVSE